MEKEFLKKEIEISNKKIKKYQELYLKNETAVRNQIINPILKALGWNIEDPGEVIPEETTEDGNADYSLTKDSERLLFIEAKNMSKDVEAYQYLQQLAKYSVSEGVDFGLLTNGKKWLLLRTYETNTRISDRKLWVVDILEDDMEKIILRLKSISKENIDNLNLLIRKQDLLSETWQTILSSPETLVKPISKIIKKQILDNDNKFSDEEVEEFTMMKLIQLTKNKEQLPQQSHEKYKESQKNTSIRRGSQTARKKPTKIIIRDFSKDIRSFKDVLVETANYLMDNKLLAETKIPISSGYKRYILNKTPNHQNGEHFTAPERLHCRYFVETHNSAQKHIEYAKRLLKESSISENDLKIL